ncbi:MAG: pilus assembly protein PilM, partial [Candidatus Hydrogenedentes bacterium]|nr:pilus assembly protein PilM [Candidatus Hydrogenedentota bacterium]
MPGGGTIDRVVITGGGACLRNIVPYLQEQFGVEVRIARPLAGLAVAPGAQEINEHPEQAAVALGLALRALQPVPIAINLVPPALLESARRKEHLFYWVLSFITLGLIGASIIPGLTAKQKLVLERIQTVKKYVQAYDPEVAENPGKKSVYETELQAARNEVAAR